MWCWGLNRQDATLPIGQLSRKVIGMTSVAAMRGGGVKEDERGYSSSSVIVGSPVPAEPVAVSGACPWLALTVAESLSLFGAGAAVTTSGLFFSMGIVGLGLMGIAR